MKPEELQLVPNTLLLMQVNPFSDERPMSRVIGFQTFQSILVTNPQLGKRQLLLSRNQALTVSFFSKTTAFKFQSRVIHVCSQPYPYLHLAYPKEVESGEVRRTQRLRTELPARLVMRMNDGNHMVDGTLTDISTAGIGFNSVEDLESGETSVTVRCNLPIAHFSRSLSTQGIIRSKSERNSDTGEFAYGIEFPELLEEDYILVSSFIYSKIKDQTPFR